MKNALIFKKLVLCSLRPFILLYFIKTKPYKNPTLEKKRQGRQNCRFKSFEAGTIMYNLINPNITLKLLK